LFTLPIRATGRSGHICVSRLGEMDIWSVHMQATGPFRDCSRGFALIELVMAIIAIAIIAALLIVAGGRSRSAGLLGQDMAKLRDISVGTGLYAADHEDRLWTFSWKRGVLYAPPGIEPGISSTDLIAAARQATWILRRRTGLTISQAPMPQGWVPHVLYSHIVLNDYLDLPLPWFLFISAADRDRLRWASDPACYNNNCFWPCQPGGSATWRWPYSASFQLVPAGWDRSMPPQRVTQATWGNYWNVPEHADLGGGLLSDVAFPSRKVLVHDNDDRHSGPVPRSFANPQARLPLLFADGRVRVKHTVDANPGWQPNQPANPHPTWFTYEEVLAPCVVGGPWPQYTHASAPGVYRWTRGGLAGRDFAGPEINTGQRAASDGRIDESEVTLEPTITMP
jgi:hypothetical protein